MSTELSPCLNCREPNSKASDECMFCGARLPWSVAPAEAVAVAMPGSAPMAMQRPMQRRDQYEWWITVVSFLIPVAGLGLYLYYLTFSPLRARSALFGLMPVVSLVLVVVLTRLATVLALMMAGGGG